MGPALRPDLQHHARGRAKDGVHSAAVAEPGSAVELQRMGVRCHLQALHTSLSQDLRDATDERGGNPASPALDKDALR